MSKAKRLYDEIFTEEGGLCWFKSKETALQVIQKHFRDVHDEAVAATVMANNKKRFVKPQYND